MFVDEATVQVFGGDGGNGCCSFRREKFVPKGGPDGGDGGSGGSVVLVADPEISTLLPFRYRTLFKAERGRHGEGANRSGRSGDDLEVHVPPGTLVWSEDGTRRLATLEAAGTRWVAARGGRGGRGNARFATSTNQAPTRHEPGEPGEHVVLRLELRLLADVGLVGFPNAGKSTLISRISAARPKIADYPFTTLEPHLGVVDLGGRPGFVVADIPGLIEGAHHGAGLGDRFLRHVERCRLLLHLVDPIPPERDPVHDAEVIDRELAAYSPELARKPRIVVVTKRDALTDEAPLHRIRRWADGRGFPCHAVSAVSGDGVAVLLHATADALATLPRPTP